MKANQPKTTLEILNTETGKTVVLGRKERRLRDKAARAANKPLNVVELHQIKNDQSAKIRSMFKPLELFLNDLIKSEISYIVEFDKEIPVIMLDNGKPSSVVDSFETCFEFCYQIMRFTKYTKTEEYINKATEIKIYLKTFCRENEELLMSEILKVKAFLELTKQYILKVPINTAKRVQDELYGDTKRLLSIKDGYEVWEVRDWLVKLGK